jgi:hypothetical protein
MPEYRTAEPHFEVHHSLFDIPRFTNRNIHDAFGSDQALFEGLPTVKPPALPEDTYLSR